MKSLLVLIFALLFAGCGSSPSYTLAPYDATPLQKEHSKVVERVFIKSVNDGRIQNYTLNITKPDGVTSSLNQTNRADIWIYGALNRGFSSLGYEIVRNFKNIDRETKIISVDVQSLVINYNERVTYNNIDSEVILNVLVKEGYVKKRKIIAQRKIGWISDIGALDSFLQEVFDDAVTALAQEISTM